MGENMISQGKDDNNCDWVMILKTHFSCFGPTVLLVLILFFGFCLFITFIISDFLFSAYSWKRWMNKSDNLMRVNVERVTG
jgi:hypothetical protein